MKLMAVLMMFVAPAVSAQQVLATSHVGYGKYLILMQEGSVCKDKGRPVLRGNSKDVKFEGCWKLEGDYILVTLEDGSEVMYSKKVWNVVPGEVLKLD